MKTLSAPNPPAYNHTQAPLVHPDALLRAEMTDGNHNQAALAALAIDAIRHLLTDPNTPAAVRLRAAKFVLESIDAQAQDAQPPEDSKPARAPQPNLPKIGRNDYCYCGSGLKFKKCCLLKPAQRSSITPPAFEGTRAP